MKLTFVENNKAISLLVSAVVLSLFIASGVLAQKIDDGSDAAVGKESARIVLDLIGRHIPNSSDAKVTELRKSEGSWICGSVNVRNKDGLYAGERGFVADVANAVFGRVPDGPEMLSSRASGFAEKESVRQLYFKLCLD